MVVCKWRSKHCGTRLTSGQGDSFNTLHINVFGKRGQWQDYGASLFNRMSKHVPDKLGRGVPLIQPHLARQM
jgi:hypothetical protein